MRFTAATWRRAPRQQLSYRNSGNEGVVTRSHHLFQHRLLNAVDADSGVARLSRPPVHTQAMVRGCTTKCGAEEFTLCGTA